MRLTVALATAALLSCSSGVDSSEQRTVGSDREVGTETLDSGTTPPPGSATADGAAPTTVDRSTSTAVTAGVLVPLNEAAHAAETKGRLGIAETGPEPVVLDAEALASVIRTVFGSEPRNWPGDTEYAFFRNNPRVVMTAADRRVLGDWAPRPGTHVQYFVNLSEMPTLSRDYLRALRAILGNTCRGLVRREAALADRSSAILFTNPSGAPTVAAMSKFMCRYFGCSNPSRTVDGAADLVKVFAAQVADAERGGARISAGALEDLYVLSCVSVGTDPRGYLR